MDNQEKQAGNSLAERQARLETLAASLAASEEAICGLSIAIGMVVRLGTEDEVAALRQQQVNEINRRGLLGKEYRQIRNELRRELGGKAVAVIVAQDGVQPLSALTAHPAVTSETPQQLSEAQTISDLAVAARQEKTSDTLLPLDAQLPPQPMGLLRIINHLWGRS